MPRKPKRPCRYPGCPNLSDGVISAHIGVVHIPTEHWMPAVAQLVLQNKAHQFLRRRRHILKALTEGNDCKAHAFQILNHLDSSPTVKGDFPDVEPLT